MNQMILEKRFDVHASLELGIMDFRTRNNIWSHLFAHKNALLWAKNEGILDI